MIRQTLRSHITITIKILQGNNADVIKYILILVHRSYVLLHLAATIRVSYVNINIFLNVMTTSACKPYLLNTRIGTVIK